MDLTANNKGGFMATVYFWYFWVDVVASIVIFIIFYKFFKTRVSYLAYNLRTKILGLFKKPVDETEECDADYCDCEQDEEENQ
jgi:hypothetical protein